MGVVVTVIVIAMFAGAVASATRARRRPGRNPVLPDLAGGASRPGHHHGNGISGSHHGGVGGGHHG